MRPLLLLSCLLAACDAHRVAPAGPLTTPGDDPDGPDTWTTAAVDVVREGVPARVTSVRAAEHATFDRVVVELAGDGVPGWHVAYVDGPALECGSGAPMDVAGAARLEVRLSPAEAHDEEGATIPKETAPGLPVVREIERSCDFEAVTALVVGVTAAREYRVFELSSPARLVIDVKH